MGVMKTCMKWVLSDQLCDVSESRVRKRKRTFRLSLSSYAVVFVVSTPSHTLTTMPLKRFDWNDLYAAHLDKRAFAKKRILNHFNRFALADRGVGRASVRYVTFECRSFN